MDFDRLDQCESVRTVVHFVDTIKVVILNEKDTQNPTQLLLFGLIDRLFRNIDER